jgi:hypothetical protein
MYNECFLILDLVRCRSLQVGTYACSPTWLLCPSTASECLLAPKHRTRADVVIDISFLCILHLYNCINTSEHVPASGRGQLTQPIFVLPSSQRLPKESQTLYIDHPDQYAYKRVRLPFQTPPYWRFWCRQGEYNVWCRVMNTLTLKLHTLSSYSLACSCGSRTTPIRKAILALLGLTSRFAPLSWKARL